MEAWAGKDFCHHGWPLPSFLLHIDQGKGGRQEVPHHRPWVPRMARLSSPEERFQLRKVYWVFFLNLPLQKMGVAFYAFSVAATIPNYLNRCLYWEGTPQRGKLLQPDPRLGSPTLSPSVRTCLHAKSLQSCVILCDSMDCSPPGSSVYGTLQTRILEWVAMYSSRGSSQPRDQNCISCISCIDRQVLYSLSHLGSPNKCM